VTVAWALRPLAETVTWKFPLPFCGAVYSPVLLIEPPPGLTTCQAKAGCEFIALPNWSSALAVNCCVAPLASVTLVGEMLRLVRVWTTFTVTLLVADRPIAFVTVTVKV